MPDRGRSRHPSPSAPDVPAGLIVHPTALSLRQFQRRALEQERFLDGRGHMTLAALLSECADAAARRGLLRDRQGRVLRPAGDLDRELAIVEAAARFGARPPLPLRVLDRLAAPALEETLGQMIETVSPLADRAEDFLHLLEAGSGPPKNRELAALYRAYDRMCGDLGVAPEAAVNAAILALLRGDRPWWPPCLRDAATVTFVAVRWVAPFLEAVIRELSRRLGPDRVRVRHVLAEYEQDWWGRDLMAGAGRLLFGPESAEGEQPPEPQAEATREAVAALTSLREGLAMSDAVLAAEARPRVGFSCSMGSYGEIEDLARRIAWELTDRQPPLRPEDVALVARDLGAYSDAIVDVFARFGIPVHFRRGVPLLSAPVARTVLNLARFSATRSRDVLCDLLMSPWLDWPTALGDGAGVVPVAAGALADAILRSGIEPVIPEPLAVLRRRLAAWFGAAGTAPPEAEAAAAAFQRAVDAALGVPAPATLGAGLADLLARCERFRVRERIEAWLDAGAETGLERRAYLLNARAFAETRGVLDTLCRHALMQEEGAGPVAWAEVTAVVSRALENLTVAPAPPDESGVWVLNPHDAAGLRFKLVLVAGLNASVFPRVPEESPLFSDAELDAARRTLAAAGPLPASALAGSRVRNTQENLLLLTTLAAARERLVLSCASHGETGQALTPSVFFSTVWRLVGWPAFGDDLPAEPPDAYDRWRLREAGGHFVEHWRRCRERAGRSARSAPLLPPHRRQPFPGESFLGTVPLVLCRSADECRQRLAWEAARASAPSPPTRGPAPAPGTPAARIAAGIRVENARAAFLEALAAAADTGNAVPPAAAAGAGGRYAGVLASGVWARMRRDPPDGVWDFSPTDLETLAACPYQYYLERVLKVAPLETNELEASAKDFGSAMHRILYCGFELLRGGTAPTAVSAVSRGYAALLGPRWAVAEGDGAWRLLETDERPPATAPGLPLVRFDAGPVERYEAFFDALTEAMLDWALRGGTNWMLGAPEQWNIQRRRIRRFVRDVVRLTVECCARPEPDGVRRFPALLEHVFDSREGGRPDGSPSVTLSDPGRPGRTLRVHGKLDRLDLLFDAHGALAGVSVVDYKGPSESKVRSRALAEAIATGGNCQLPVYGLAARDRFGPEVPVRMQYLSYGVPPKDMRTQFHRGWLGLDGAPLEPADLAALCGEGRALLDAFRAAVFRAVDRFVDGAFTVTPRDCGHCPFLACCRYAAEGLPAPPPEEEP
jgi:hypothetical protein